MLFHLSIDADNPKHVAEVFAEFWQGRIMPFAPVAQGSWMVLAGDERNNLIEVYPRGTELVQQRGDADAAGVQARPGAGSATHIAIGTQLSKQQVFDIAQREGWPAKYRKRGGMFGVVEIWVEGWRMIEVLTPEMQREYLDMARH